MQEKNAKTILVVDDDHLICWGLEKIISGENFHVTSVHNGTDALAEVARSCYQCVFLDINLPDINGLEVFKEIRKLSPETKVVILTGNDVDNNREKALKDGAFHFISKPFNISDIRQTVHNATGNHAFSPLRQVES